MKLVNTRQSICCALLSGWLGFSQRFYTEAQSAQNGGANGPVASQCASLGVPIRGSCLNPQQKDQCCSSLTQFESLHCFCFLKVNNPTGYDLLSKLAPRNCNFSPDVSDGTCTAAFAANAQTSAPGGPTTGPTTSLVGQGNSTADKIAADAQYISDVFLDKWRIVVITLTAVFALTLLLFVALLLHLRVRKHSAIGGDSKAARKIILPAFEPLLWVLALDSLVWLGIFLWISNISVTQNRIARTLLGSRVVMIIAPMALLYQSSLSLSSTVVATTIAVLSQLLLLLPPLLDSLSKTAYDDVIITPFWNKSSSIAFYVKLPVILFFILVLIFPPCRANRSAIIQYALASLVIVCTSIAGHIVTSFITPDSLNLIDVGLYIASAAVVTWALFPWFIWRLLRADTDFWRGKGQQAGALIGKLNRSLGVNETMAAEGLHGFVDQNRSHVIDFAFLSVGEELRVAETSTTYRGKLRNKFPVAIKVFSYSEELSDSILADISLKAALYCQLSHPNIVEFYGLSVCPPHIFFVTALHQKKLSDLIKSQPDRSPSIDICYMLDCARAVAYLHEQAAPIAHRAIRANNFVLDERRTSGRLRLEGFDRSIQLRDLHKQRVLGRTQKLGDLWNLDNAQYMAPEEFEQEVTSDIVFATDIYALTITLWEILSHGRLNAYKTTNMYQLRSLIAGGTRPSVEHIRHDAIRGLLERGWHVDPMHRPKATEFVVLLEQAQSELNTELATQLFYCVEKQPVPSGRRRISLVAEGNRRQAPNDNTLVSGHAIADFILKHAYADSVLEAYRLGNALQESGYIHHYRHKRAFELSKKRSIRFSRLQPMSTMELIASVEALAETSKVPSGTASTRMTLSSAADWGIGGPDLGDCNDSVRSHSGVWSFRSESIASEVILPFTVDTDCACKLLARGHILTGAQRAGIMGRLHRGAIGEGANRYSQSAPVSSAASRFPTLIPTIANQHLDYGSQNETKDEAELRRLAEKRRELGTSAFLSALYPDTSAAVADTFKSVHQRTQSQHEEDWDGPPAGHYHEQRKIVLFNPLDLESRGMSRRHAPVDSSFLRSGGPNIADQSVEKRPVSPVFFYTDRRYHVMDDSAGNSDTSESSPAYREFI